MKIITRYIAREFSKNFALGIAALTVVFLIVEFFERINAFLYNKASFPLMGAYFFNKLPFFTYLAAPAAILLASIVTLGLMSRNNEIIAMKSGGISLWSITSPILKVVLIIYLILLGMNEYILPSTNQKAREIQDWIILKKKPIDTFKQSQLWIHSNNAIYNIQLYHPERDSMEGITIYRFNIIFQMYERIDARSAQWKDNRWIFSDVSVTRMKPGGAPERKNYPELTIPLPESPSDFRIAEKNPDEMNFRELRKYVNKVEQDGYNASKYECAMHANISFPFIGVIMAFIGVPLALRKERGAAIAMGFAFSILISFACWVAFSFCLELGKAGTLPPFLAAWLSNIIFALVGVFLYLSVRH
jgi:lipopolysaccharide export system permease protein